MRAILVTLFIYLLSSAESIAQTTFFSTRTPAVNHPLSMKRFSDGNFVFGFMDQFKAYVTKQDSAGQQIWNTEILYSYPIVFEVEEAADGGVLVLTQASFGPNQCPFIIKLDLTGQVTWMKSYHDAAHDQFSDIVAMPDNGFAAVGGGCAGTDYIMRADQNGNILWMKNFVEASNVPPFNFYKFLLTDNGQTFTISGNSVQGDLMLLKCDTAGNFIWKKEYQIPVTYEMSFAMCEVNSGLPGAGVAVAVWIVSTTTATSYTQPGIAQFDNYGNLQWMAKYIFPSQAWPYSIYQLSDRSLVLGGTINNPLDSMYRRGLLMGVDQFGQQQWTQAFSDSVYSDFGPQFVSDINQCSPTEMYVAGGGFKGFFGRFTTTGFGACSPAFFSPATVFIQPVTYASPNMGYSYPPLVAYPESFILNNGIFVTQHMMCANVITDVLSTQAEEWSVIPDAGSQTISIRIPQSGNYEMLNINLVDVQGKNVLTICSQPSADHAIQISTSSLASGMYCLRIEATEQVLHTCKVTILSAD